MEQTREGLALEKNVRATCASGEEHYVQGSVAARGTLRNYGLWNGSGVWVQTMALK